MNMSQFAFGVDYRVARRTATGTVCRSTLCLQASLVCLYTQHCTNPSQRVIWSIDRFNARKGNQLVDAHMSKGTERHSAAENQLQLAVINREKTIASGLINEAISGSWIGYANAMGLVYRELDSPDTRTIVTMRDLRQTFRDMGQNECIAAVYFLTGYTRDVLHQQVLYGCTHQVAVEDYVMMILNAEFETPRSELKPGHRTCVSQLYSQIYNTKQQKLKQQVLPKQVSVAVVSNGYKYTPNWKRPKTHYFVHKKHMLSNGTLRSETKLVSAKCNSMRKECQCYN